MFVLFILFHSFETRKRKEKATVTKLSTVTKVRNEQENEHENLRIKRNEMLLSAIRATYDSALTPIAPFTWFGSNISTFDVAAALRLCVVLRQLREAGLRAHHAKVKKNNRIGGGGDKNGDGGDLVLKDGSDTVVEERSYVKCIATTLVTVYGGEAIMCASVYLIYYSTSRLELH